MGADQPESDATMELDDSGCVQDDSPPLKSGEMQNGYVGQANLLDLSDDVLLYILRYCSPHDLKALGYSCPRLGALVLERSLWSRVDVRSVCYGRNRARWLLRHALHSGTKELKFTGLAKLAQGCEGHVNRTRRDVFEERLREYKGAAGGAGGAGGGEGEEDSISEPERNAPAHRGGSHDCTLFRHGIHLPRISSSPSWPESDSEDSDAELDTGDKCEGPMFTLGRHMLKRLRVQCPRLTSLYLEYCNIDCNKMALCYMPPTLKRLSLKGTRCYNLPVDKSYLFKIHDYLPDLEYLVLSECAWLEPASLLPLSKMPRLLKLFMCNCPCMQEFVAYVSLATRYGFRTLQVLDLRESPVGDSEVSALGWLPDLRELYLSAREPDPPSPPTHHHYIGDRRRRLADTELWESEIPEHYQDSTGRDQDLLQGRHMEDTEYFRREQQNFLRVHGFAGDSFGHDQNRYAQEQDGETSLRNTSNSLNLSDDLEREGNSERKRKTENWQSDQEAGPSKRVKDDDINATIANIQNSEVTVTKKGGVVCFRRTIFNNVTDINERLNGNDETDNKKEIPKKDGEPSPKKDGEPTPKKDAEPSPKKVGESSQEKDGELSSKNDGEPSLQKGGEPSPKKDGEPFPQKGGEPSSKKDGELSSRNDGEPSPQKGGEPSPKKDGEPSQKKDGESSPKKYGEPSWKKDGEPSRKQDGESSRMSDSRHYGNINVFIDDGTCIRDAEIKIYKNRSTNTEHENQSTSDKNPEDASADNEEMDTDNEPPAKKMRLESDDKKEKMSTDQSDDSSDKKMNESDGSTVAQPIQGTSTDKSDINDPSQVSTQRETGEDLPLATQARLISIQNRINRLRRSVGLELEPNQVGPIHLNGNRRIPSPSMEGPSRPSERGPQYVRISRNHDPVVIQCPARQNEQAQPRHHVLYVNLGQQLHAVYRLLPSRALAHQNLAISTERLDSSSLVSDAAIRRFGRADGDDVNIVNIGPHRIDRESCFRPNRSNLRILYATGYRNITNQSLMHLVTASPYLQVVDFSETGVTESGVEQFKSLRPDVQITWSQYKEQNED